MAYVSTFQYSLVNNVFIATLILNNRYLTGNYRVEITDAKPTEIDLFHIFKSKQINFIATRITFKILNH